MLRVLPAAAAGNWEFQLVVFVIDSLQGLHFTATRAQYRQRDVVGESSDLMSLAIELDVPVMASHQWICELTEPR